jgi:hypothetical protein
VTLDEIKAAVRAGKTVCEGHPGCQVRLWLDGRGKEMWDIVCLHNGYTIGLTWRDGVTPNVDLDACYILEDA